MKNAIGTSTKYTTPSSEGLRGGALTAVSIALLLTLSSFHVEANTEDAGNFLHGISQNEYRSLLINYDSVLSERAPYDLDNYSEIDMNYSTNASVKVIQESKGNYGNNRSIVSTSGDSNKVSVNQKGRNNSALVLQRGDRNKATIMEQGVNNEAAIIQRGSDNTAEITLNNRSISTKNQVSVKQTGNGNTAKISHQGSANLGVVQVGTDHALVVNASQSMRVHISQSN